MFWMLWMHPFVRLGACTRSAELRLPEIYLSVLYCSYYRPSYFSLNLFPWFLVLIQFTPFDFFFCFVLFASLSLFSSFSVGVHMPLCLGAEQNDIEE